MTLPYRFVIDRELMRGAGSVVRGREFLDHMAAVERLQPGVVALQDVERMGVELGDVVPRAVVRLSALREALDDFGVMYALAYHAEGRPS